MDLVLANRILMNWYEEVGHKIKYCPPEAKFVTGIPNKDAQLHSFQLDSGLNVTWKISDWGISIADLCVDDKLKYMMFALRWS